MKPTHFDVEHALEFIRQLVSADEVITALDILENKFPAYYRDHPTTSMILCKENIYKKIATVQDYFLGEGQPIVMEEILHEYETTPRYKFVEQIVRSINDQQREAYVCDFGPGQAWLPIGLKHNGLKFKYRPITITNQLFKEAHELLSDVIAMKPEFNQPQVFTCFEVIEHLFNLSDVYNYYCRENLNAEHIVISTPKYSLGGGWKRDHAEMIAHIRTFTPTEMVQWCAKTWPAHKWQFIDGVQMMAYGSRINA